MFPALLLIVLTLYALHLHASRKRKLWKPSK